VEVRPHVLERGATDFEPADPIILPRGRAVEVASGGRRP
jgi:hypothetical protein